MKVFEQNPNVTMTVTSKVLSPKKCKLTGIYGLRNKVNGKWYIGQSIDIHGRWDRYRRLACKAQPKLFAALSKHGFDSFESIILEECEKSNLNERETHWIGHYNAHIQGYNISPGGFGCRPSEETRLKLSLSHMGQSRPCSEEKKAKLSAIFKGRKFRPEWKEKLRVAQLGRKHSEETKAKMRLAQQRRYSQSMKLL